MLLALRIISGRFASKLSTLDGIDLPSVDRTLSSGGYLASKNKNALAGIYVF